MIQLQYFNGKEWENVGEPWYHEELAWASLGSDTFNYRTIDEKGNIIHIDQIFEKL